MKVRLGEQKEVPALCPNCGYVFNTHVVFYEYPVEMINGVAYEKIEDESFRFGSISLYGEAQCPKCNYEEAQFRTDLFKFVKETFDDLKQLGLPEIVYLEGLFKKLSANFTEENYQKTKEDAENEIKGLKIFEILSKYTKNEHTANIIGLLSLIFSILAYLQSCIGTKEEPKVVNVYNVTLKQEIKEETTSKIYHTGNLKKVPPKVKSGRNDPCSCKSGKKFKNCCGKNL